jgi:UDP-N-acetylmuramoyl-tripeptide--D-alanyl-D-alanine ligase
MADGLWTKDELLAALNAEIVGSPPRAIGGISIDTRTIQPGELFFAIKGDRTDGHDYVDQAFAAGAGLALVGRDFRGNASGPFLRVEDTLEALNALGRAGRARAKARVVAVTGSVGKTGTKEMLRLMLSRLGCTHASDKSYNNHWGVPLSLARLPRDAAYAVFEIGMNHPGEIIPLTKMVRPHAAIVTTIAPVHIAFFRDLEQIAEAKAEIFQGLEAGGTAIINKDNAFYPLLAARARENGASEIVSFSRWCDTDAEVRLMRLEASADRSVIEANLLGETIHYKLGAPGEHLAANSLAALAGVRALGGDAGLAADALGEFGAPVGRGAQSLHEISGGGFRLIDESYNANPASMAAAFGVLAAVGHGRRIAVLGDMLELGAASAEMHRGLAEPLAADSIDLVFTCGEQMRALHEVLPSSRQGAWAPDSESLKAPLIEALRAGDTIMIKGSLGSRMGLIVEVLKQMFPPLTTGTRNATA